MIQTKRINNVDVTYTIADPKTDSINVTFKLGSTVKELGQTAKADVAANFNYADNNTGTPIGRVIASGKTVTSDIPKTLLRDELYMLPDKSLHIGKAPKGVLWALQGSPRLLMDGVNVVTESLKRDQLDSSAWAGKHIQIACGITQAGWLVVARTEQAVTLDELSHIMLVLGCINAIKGDGGGSAYLYPADNGWGRKMGVALIIKKGEDEVSKPELIIDASHGGTDPGASGNGIVEKIMTLAISLYQFNRFKELGVPVAITRTTDEFIDSTPRATLVKNSGAKYCISNHINAATSTTASGVEVIRSIKSDGKLATALMEAVAAAGQPKRSTPIITKTQSDGQDWYFMQRLTGSVSTVTVEYGFCTNAADAARLKANWQKYAEAVVKAFCLFIGYKYIAPAPVVTPPVKPQEPISYSTFKDVPDNHWAIGSIKKAKAIKLVVGKTDGTLGLGEGVTIERLLVILDRLGELDKEVK